MFRLLLPFLIGSTLAFADADGGVRPPLQVRSRAVPTTAKLGEPFVVELVVTHDKAQRYDLKPPGELGDFDFRSVQRSRVDGPDSSTTTFQVSLAAFTLGKQTTPALTLDIADGAQTYELPAMGTEVEIVASLPADAQQQGANLLDVRPPEEVAVRTWRLLYGLAGLVAAGLAAWGLMRLWKRYRKAKAEFVKPPEPLHVRASQALDALAKENLPGQGRAREFYFRLSEIMRGYLGERFGFEALESTTPELLQALRSRHTPGLPIEELTAFANESDYVRYAKLVPGPDDCKVQLELGYRIIHATTAAAVVRPATESHGPQRVP